MKLLKIFVLAGIVAAVAIYFRPAARHPASQTAPLAEVTVVSTAPVHFHPHVVTTLRVTKSFDPLAHSRDLLRSKLRQWQESEINDPDDKEGRAQLLKEMLAMVTDENVAEIIQSLSAEEMNTPFGTGALHHWMQVDPIAASNWLASRPETTQDEISAITEDWAKTPDTLKQYLNQLPDTAWKQNFLEAASSQMSLNDPLDAIQLAQQMKPGDAQTNLLRAVANGWVSTDPAAAMNWVANVKDPSLREQLVASALQSYALTDPAQAATWLVSEVKSDGIVKDSALNILSTWVTTDPAAAANWAAQFPEGDIKAAAVKVVSTYWQQINPDAAAAWLQNLASGNQTPIN